MAIEKPWDATPEQRETIRKEFEAAIERDKQRTFLAEGPEIQTRPRGYWVVYWATAVISLSSLLCVPAVLVLAILSLLKYLGS